jgi:hypothetical protein
LAGTIAGNFFEEAIALSKGFLERTKPIDISFIRLRDIKVEKLAMVGRWAGSQLYIFRENENGGQSSNKLAGANSFNSI